MTDHFLPANGCRFWIVYSDQRGVEPYRYSTAQAAEAMASRLAEQNPAPTFYTMRAGTSHRGHVTVTSKTLNHADDASPVDHGMFEDPISAQSPHDPYWDGKALDKSKIRGSDLVMPDHSIEGGALTIEQMRAGKGDD